MEISDLTFDPVGETGWSEFRALAHRMVDDLCGHLESVSDRPVWQPMPPDVRSSFHEPLPRVGIGASGAYHQFVHRVLRYTNGNIHPRFWGWVQGNGTPLGMMADMLAAGINPHLAGFDQAPAMVEHQVLAWLQEIVGMPASASGVLVGGGTMANILCLAVARHRAAERLGFDVREDGMQGTAARLTCYGSDETHNWARKGVELLGLGNRSFRRIAVDSDYRIELDALRRAVADDRKNECAPFCVIGTAGTVNTGATDDLGALADFCRDEGLWFHVDGAFGALLHMSERFRPIVAGIERADSVGFDLHKWMSLPFECACVVVRDAAVHEAAFASSASYIALATRGVIAAGLPFAQRGIDLTRNFKALKVWMSLQAHGTEKIAGLIEQNIDHAQYLASLIRENPSFELVAPAPLNIVCFRFVAAGASDGELNAINEELLLRVQESGVAIPSGTTLGGRFSLRVGNVNHRTRRSDFDLLVDSASAIGHAIVEERARGHR